jgi:hypothetical protein
MDHGKKGYIDKKLSEGRGPWTKIRGESEPKRFWWRSAQVEQIPQGLWELTREGRRAEWLTLLLTTRAQANSGLDPE